MPVDLLTDTLLEEVPRKDGQIVLGPCYLVRKLGQGAMGAVYEGHHIALDSRVAVKVLPDYLAAKDPKFIERFQREARTAFKVRHPGVVAVLDVGQDPTSKVHYLVMEFVEGESAGDLLKRLKKLNEATALDIAIGVAEALNAALKVKVIHRDIKPDNIMIAKDGQVKLADMGLAKQQTAADDAGEAGMTMANVAMGTPYYMSPEAAQDAKNVDHRADIYSLGVSLFELVTGDVPYRDKTTFAIMMKHVQAPMPNPKDIAPHLSDELCRILQKMLEKRTDARYQTPEALLKDLRACRDQHKGEPGLAGLFGPLAGQASVIVEDGGATLAISHADQQRILTMRSQSGVEAHAQTSADPGKMTPVDGGATATMPGAQAQAIARKGTSQNAAVAPAATPVKPPAAPRSNLETAASGGSKTGLIIAGVLVLLLFIGGGLALVAWLAFKSDGSTNPPGGGTGPGLVTNVNPPGTTTPGTTPGTSTPGTSPGSGNPATNPGTNPGTTPGTNPATNPGGAVLPDPAAEAAKLQQQNALLADARAALGRADLDDAKLKLDAADKITLATPNPALAEAHTAFNQANEKIQAAKAKLALAERNYQQGDMNGAYDNAKAALDALPALTEAQALMGLSAAQSGRAADARFQLTAYLKNALPENKFKYVNDARAALAALDQQAQQATADQQKTEARKFIDDLLHQEKFTAAQAALTQQSAVFSDPERKALSADIESKRAAAEKIAAQNIRAKIAAKNFPAAEDGLKAAAGCLAPATATSLAQEIAAAREAANAEQARLQAAKLKAENLARLRDLLTTRIGGKDYPGARTALADLTHAGADPAELAAFAKQVDALKPHEAKLTCKTIAMEMLFVPAATFTMGSDKGDADEGPAKKITLTKGFYMAQTEVTYAMYKQFLDDNPDHPKPADEKRKLLRPDGPIVGISFNDAVDFCAWLSDKEGRTYSLPTEAQWEYAARGTDERRFPWGSKLLRDQTEMALYLKCGDTKAKGLQPVGSFPKGASPFGILDLAGNAAEWCRDAYAETIYTSPDHPAVDPLVVGVGAKYKVNEKARVVRGGDYATELANCRTTKREFQNAEFNECNNTIRLVTPGD